MAKRQAESRQENGERRKANIERRTPNAERRTPEERSNSFDLLAADRTVSE
jgi:hypothetical protein